ncbi:mucin-5AC-like isoform X2 [Varroa destructor]|nr:mucin-5AC-like isoform X2 [Varroa destructor]XP_022649345.1 mucin-5AC-like isoform X2 [Varroa destructor]
MSQDTMVTPTALDDVLQDRSQSVLSSDSDSIQERSGMGRKRPRPTDTKDSDRLKLSMKSKSSSLPLAAARVSNRKRIKKTHGPDWQTDILHLECKVQLSTCAVCRSKDVSGNFLACSACKVHVHARCLQLTERSVAKISANKQFYCLRCKPCKLCHYALEVSERDRGQNTLSLASIMEGGDMIHCCQCYSVFHLGCLRPALPAKPKGQPWMCRKCSYEANKKEKLKANAAAAAMLMVAQQRPLLPEKHSERTSVLSDKDSLDQQGGSGTDSDRGHATPTSNQSPTGADATATTANINENSSLRNGHTSLDTQAAAAAMATLSTSVSHVGSNGSLAPHSNGSSASARPTHEADTSVTGTALKTSVSMIRSKRSPSVAEKASVQKQPDNKAGGTLSTSSNLGTSNGASKNGSATTNGVVTGIGIVTTPAPTTGSVSTKKSTTSTTTKGSVGGTGKTGSNSLLSGNVSATAVNSGNKTAFKSTHNNNSNNCNTNGSSIGKTVTANTKEESTPNGQTGATATENRKSSELRKKLLEITAPLAISNSGGGKTDESKLDKPDQATQEQTNKIKVEEQGRQLVFIAGKTPPNTKLPAIPTLPRCEVTFHIPKQLSVSTSSLEGPTLTSLACSTPTTLTATSTSSIHHVIPAPVGSMMSPVSASSLAPIVITSIPKKPGEDNTLLSGGANSLLTSTGRQSDNLPLAASLSQIQIVPVSLAAAPPAVPTATHSAPLALPHPMVTSSQTPEPKVLSSGAPVVRTAKLSQYAVHYPNVSDWSADQVAQFLAKMGYEKESKVFVEQEIDGASLLLLKRADVLSTLGLKLGPAVKIFRHISNLQEVVAP